MVDKYREDLTGTWLDLWLQDLGIKSDFLGDNLKVLYKDSATIDQGAGTVSYDVGIIVANEYVSHRYSSPLSQWSQIQADFGEPVKFMETSVNLGGRAARFEPEAIQGMAFGVDVELDSNEGSSEIHAEVANPTGAPDARVIDIESGEVMGYQETGTVPERYDVEPGTAVTIQVGERAGDDNGEPTLFSPVGEISFIVPDDRSQIRVFVE
jgi:hypothetical protein